MHFTTLIIYTLSSWACACVFTHYKYDSHDSKRKNIRWKNNAVLLCVCWFGILFYARSLYMCYDVALYYQLEVCIYWLMWQYGPDCCTIFDFNTIFSQTENAMIGINNCKTSLSWRNIHVSVIRSINNYTNCALSNLYLYLCIVD